jgi:hypothetical protein
MPDKQETLKALLNTIVFADRAMFRTYPFDIYVNCVINFLFLFAELGWFPIIVQ